MAVDSPILYHDAWVYLRDSLGPNYGGANDRQKQNATLFYNQLRVFGYTHVSACAILGNMQTESGLSPGSLSGLTNELPNNGEHLDDLTNAVMFDWHGQGAHDTGLISWNGTAQDGGNVVASTAQRYKLAWYNWELQLFRLELEYIYDPSGWGGVNGTTYNFWYPVSGSAAITWKNFKQYTGDIGTATDYFRLYRERSSGDPDGNQHRRDNAHRENDYRTCNKLPLGKVLKPAQKQTDYKDTQSLQRICNIHRQDVRSHRGDIVKQPVEPRKVTVRCQKEAQ